MGTRFRCHEEVKPEVVSNSECWTGQVGWGGGTSRSTGGEDIMWVKRRKSLLPTGGTLKCGPIEFELPPTKSV